MRKRACISLLAMLISVTSALAAGGGKVTYPDGVPVSGAAVQVMKDEKEKVEIKTDAAGRFELPDKKFNKCIVQITAPDKTAYAPVLLPVEMFQGNELAIVLQPRK